MIKSQELTGNASVWRDEIIHPGFVHSISTYTYRSTRRGVHRNTRGVGNLYLQANAVEKENYTLGQLNPTPSY